MRTYISDVHGPFSIKLCIYFTCTSRHRHVPLFHVWVIGHQVVAILFLSGPISLMSIYRFQSNFVYTSHVLVGICMCIGFAFGSKATNRPIESATNSDNERAQPLPGRVVRFDEARLCVTAAAMNDSWRIQDSAVASLDRNDGSRVYAPGVRIDSIDNLQRRGTNAAPRHPLHPACRRPSRRSTGRTRTRPR